ncbi:MAG: hypothetical protein JKX76_03135 [Colwellia sp.]|nr:hypothetical protein [Colwellia sp.]
MDLLVNEPGISTLALSHYYKHPSGDLIADPDMTMKVDFNHKTVIPLTYQDTFGYQDVFSSGLKNDTLEKELLTFLTLWLINLNSQGYSISYRN